MNEQILNLAEQAGFKSVGKLFGQAVPEYAVPLEKFAELIVQECIRLCDQVDVVGADECIDNIKEHFGVQ